MGIWHLFIDVISIDQQLTGNELLDQVVEFSMLYRYIPVIAAYDKTGADFTSTMRRPWISSEIRTYRSNPTKIVYVSHNDQGAQRGRISFPGPQGSRGADESGKCAFPLVAEIIWDTSFTTTFMMVLKGTIGMLSIYDLKYIMPAYAPILEAAERRWFCREDYLLTAAILAQGESYTSLVNDDDNRDNMYYPTDNEFERYDFKTISETAKEDTYDVLRGRSVATWSIAHNFVYDAYYCKLRAAKDAERVIYNVLEMSASGYETYLTEKKKYQSSFEEVEGQDNGSLPVIEVVSISLEAEYAGDLEA